MKKESGRKKTEKTDTQPIQHFTVIRLCFAGGD